MTTVHTLASGSSGNAAVLSCGDTHLLIDAGISCRRITAALKELGLTPADLTAILITHTHSDHISGLNTLLKKTTCPLLATPRTCRELSCRVEGIDPRLMGLDGPITLGEIDMQPIPTSHDAPGSCGWRLDTESGSVGFLTDTGYVTDEALDLLPGVDLVILEANHDVEALCSGPYPYYLKQRILGLQGHLCNEDAAQFAVTLVENGASDIVLAHLSRDNNTPAMALNAVAAALDGAGLAPGHRRPVSHRQKEGLMQKVTILCTGKLKEKFYLDAVAEYVKRLSRFCKLEIIELPEERLPEDPSPAQIEAALSKEADAVRAKLPNGCLVIAMCVEGRERSSEELARYLADSAAQGASHIVFLIGSSFGMHESLKRQAALRLSMSPMTFPHHLLRVMLLEQIYRAYQINAGSRYHK